MADADYGYVGAGVGRIALYRGKVCVERGIPKPKPWSTFSSLSRKTKNEDRRNNF